MSHLDLVELGTLHVSLLIQLYATVALNPNYEPALGELSHV